MRIQEIKIKNYRQYQDQTFSFQHTKGCDLHLVIGQNTLGKTNLLNSIAWCLFFEEPHMGNKYKAQPIVNLKTLTEVNEGDKITVSVSIKVQYDGSTLIFNREAIYEKRAYEVFLKSTFLEVIQTQEDGINNWYQNDEATRMVNRFVPHGLQEFFFFDGEQLDTYFISDKRTHIESPIFEISQVGLLNKVIEHLESIIVDFKREAGKGHPDIEGLFTKQDNAISKKKAIESEIVDCESQISLSDSIIYKCTEFLKGTEDVNTLENEKQQYSLELAEIKKQIEEKKIELKDFIREYSTKINLYPSIIKTLKIIKAKEDKGELPPNIDRNLLLDSLEKEECLVCKNILDDVHKENIERFLEKIKISSDVSHILVKVKGPLEKIIEEIKGYPELRDSILTSLSDLLTTEKKILEKLSLVENRLSNCSNKELIKNTINERKQHEKLREENIERKGVLGERINSAKIEVEEAVKEYETALLKSQGQEKLISSKEFAENSLRLAIEIRNEMMNEMREKIRSRMQELFLKLIWRKNTYKEVVLDDEYSMSLIHLDGYECLGSISAAERALLALSFTLSLHDVSGFDSPLVIDTPVARISDINRKKFAEILAEISLNKELILLLTPSEYSIEIAEIFDNCNSSKYVLQTEDEKTTYIRRD